MLGGLIGILIYGAAIVYPLYLTLPHVGLNAWYALGAFIPFGLPVLLWLVAIRIQGAR